MLIYIMVSYSSSGATEIVSGRKYFPSDSPDSTEKLGLCF